MRYLMKIDGMGCQHCVKRVKDALEAAGAEDLNVEIGKAEAKFAGAADSLKKAVEDAGYNVLSVEEIL